MVAAADIFSHAHIGLTAAATGLIAAVIGIWRLTGSRRVANGLLVGLLAGTANYLWRSSANMSQLNLDGLRGFSANDWLAPIVVFVVISVFADLYPPVDARRFGQARAAATVVALVVNVITI